MHAGCACIGLVSQALQRASSATLRCWHWYRAPGTGQAKGRVPDTLGSVLCLHWHSPPSPAAGPPLQACSAYTGTGSSHGATGIGQRARRGTTQHARQQACILFCCACIGTVLQAPQRGRLCMSALLAWCLVLALVQCSRRRAGTHAAGGAKGVTGLHVCYACTGTVLQAL
jgi:hypothetical protein